MDNYLEHITIDHTICHGKPTIRGLRYPVENMLELMASGMTIDELLEVCCKFLPPRRMINVSATVVKKTLVLPFLHCE